MLVILSIFNLVLAAPVVREKRDAHDKVAVPVVVRNLAAMSKERRGGSDGSAPSDSSPPLPHGSPSHSSPPLPGESTPLDASPLPSDEEALFHGPPSDEEAPLRGQTPPGGPAVSSRPSAGRPGTAGLHLEGPFPLNMIPTATVETLMTKVGKGLVVLSLAGGATWLIREKNNLGRAIDPEWYVSNPHLSCRRPNHKSLTYKIFLSSTVKGSQHQCLDY